MASVDVVVPCYNYGRFLRACVGSVLAQEGVAVRVLVIDDCSTDDSADVGRALAAEDPRVTFRRHERNRGHTATYNEGLEWVAGDYCLLLSADDLITQGALSRAVGVMEQHPQVGMTYGEVVRTAAPDFSSVPAPGAYETVVHTGPDFVEACCRACSNLVETATAVVRTTIQKRVGGYRPELPHSCDLEMWLRCASVSSIGCVKVPQGFYRRHASNMSHNYVNRKDYDQVKAAFDFFFAGPGSRLADGPRLAELARRGFAVQAFYLANDAFNAGDGRLCRQLLAEALGLWPGVRAHRGWRRLQMKRVVGTRLCALGRSLFGRRRAGHSARW
jgi:glycosyltransferase involved in cell wall biosynthesis